MKELLDHPDLTVDAVWGQAEPVLLKKDDIENMHQGTEIRDLLWMREAVKIGIFPE